MNLVFAPQDGNRCQTLSTLKREARP